MADGGGVKLVAPDGGWGWMVVLAMSITNVITIPLLQNFGLLFRDVFKVLNMSAKQATIIINTNAAFGYILGVFNGPILRNLGFRKVAMAGGLMMFIGLFVTSFATEFVTFFIFYGLINSLGIGWSMASCHLALSTYFVERRGMAMGIAMTITGLGPVFMPLVISRLMAEYSPRGAALLLSGLVLHTILAGQLLQPIKWHRKRISNVEENGVSKVNNEDEGTALKKVITDIDAPGGDMIEAVIDENHVDVKNSADPEAQKVLLNDTQKKKVYEDKADDEPWYHKVARIFDLDLLKDPAFLSMCVGMSIALASDMNFSLLLPLILDDYEFDTDTTAKIQAIVGAADLLSRFFTPFITRRTKLSARLAYLFSLFGLILSRYWLTLIRSEHMVMLVVAMFGASKGVRAVFMPLVIPNYVPLEKLPTAQGLQNVMHGLFLMALGPLIGYIRDRMGNYMLCIHIMNSLTAFTIVLWTIEFLFLKSKKNTFVDNVNVER